MSDPEYQQLAPAYDLLQRGENPAAWADYVQRLDRQFSCRIESGDGQVGRPLLLDLGCGTGGFCLEMLRRG